VIGAVGCSSEPLSPEEAAEIGETSQAISVSGLTSLNAPARYAGFIDDDDNSNGKVWRFGGESAAGTFTNIIRKYDKNTNAWTTTLQNLSANRYLPAVAKIPGTNFVAIAGGVPGTRNADIDLYDLVNDTITTLSNVLPANFRPQIVPCGLANSGAGGNGQKMLISLGDTASGASPDLKVLTFNTTPASSTVADLKDGNNVIVKLATGRKSHNMLSVAANHQTILVAVGNDGSSVRGDSEQLNVSSSCVVDSSTVEADISGDFNIPKAAQIKTLPSSAVRQNAALVRVEPTVSSVVQEAMLFSGDTGAATPDTTFVYDVGTKTWSAGAALPTGYGRTFAPVAVSGRATPSTAIVGMAGGELLAGTPLATFATYNPATNAWTASATTLDTARKGNWIAPIGSTSSMDALFLAGHGSDNSSPTPTFFTDVE
jgi:hypothetical protein